MIIKPLIIGNLKARLPIIQGGMGVGVSLSKLAGTVASQGAIGVISAAHPGYKEEDFERNSLKANLRGLKKHIEKAKEYSKGGIIGVNIMVAMTNYAEYVKASIEAGADIIISGAGLPKSLPQLVKESAIKIAPIVSSLKAAKVILRLWDKYDNVTPDMIIVEGAKAGGHLGFKLDDLENNINSLEDEVKAIIEEKKKYEEKYNKQIPVIAAGGIFDGNDIAKFLKLGADGVQMGTRFVATYECDASDEFKNAFINSKKDDITIVKSPVGMPGRGIRNKFIKRFEECGNIKVNKCYDCLIPCNPRSTPYCISEALINSASGNVDNGLIFCGSNAYRLNKLISVKELLTELEEQILNN